MLTWNEKQNKKYHIVGTVSNSNGKKLKNRKTDNLEHTYTCTWLSGLVQALKIILIIQQIAGFN